MKLIPVIDLMHGRVVTAKRGERHAYAPSDTPLCRSSCPREVLSALLDLHPFDTVYVADLDAIGGTGTNLPAIRDLAGEHPELRFWVDDGLADLMRVSEFARPVIGTESLIDYEHLHHLLASLPSPVLSLDFVAERFQGPAGLDQEPQHWPEEVIVMTLSRVGTAGGPDMTRLQALSNRPPQRRLYAAGGVRDQHDLQQLRAKGIAGALLSTALHQGTLDRTVLCRY
jgi:phosphoribosylformimino-5-aminoimidazole carboxamide ribotide isomerase